MIRIALIGIITAVFAVYFKGKRPELSMILALFCCVLVFGLGLTKFDVIITAINKITGYINLNTTYLSILLKIIGITYIAEFSSGICKDAGYNAIGNQIELVGKLSIIAISMPILLALIDTINEFLRIS